MVPEPSLLVRLWEFAGAALDHWLVWLTGVVLVIEQAAELFCPRFWKRFDARFPKERRRHFLLFFCAAAIVVASFQAFDDEAKRLREAESKLTASGHHLERHLTDEEKAHLVASLKPIAASLPLIYVAAMHDPEAIQYAKQFMPVFHDAGIKMPNYTDENHMFPLPIDTDTPNEHGIYIGIADKDHPNDAAVAFKRALEKAGFQPNYADVYTAAPDLLEFAVNAQ